MGTLCRTCCENVSYEDATPLDALIDESTRETLKDVLQNLLPSVVSNKSSKQHFVIFKFQQQLDLVWKPVLCNSCFVIVVGFHNFKRDCLKREALLTHYVENRQQGRRIDLFEMYPDKLRSVGCISSFTNDEAVKDEVFVFDEFQSAEEVTEVNKIKDEVVKEEIVESCEAKIEVPLNRVITCS